MQERHRLYYTALRLFRKPPQTNSIREHGYRARTWSWLSSIPIFENDICKIDTTFNFKTFCAFFG